MVVTVVVGGFFGDEGKGKIISYLAHKDNPQIIVRGGAGPNAGHTIKEEGRIYKVRMLPSGFLNKNARIMIGPGVVVDPTVLHKEIEEFNVKERVSIDNNCGIITQDHKDQDTQGMLQKKIGSTGSGTGPANAQRALRTLQLAKNIESLKSYLVDVPSIIDTAIKSKQNVLVEGTQGTFLSLWHGTYPFVTSKDVTASGICADVGIGPTKVDDVMVVFKAYVTRVGTGPLDNELSAEEMEKRGWSEVGTVTGRQRRAAEFDFNLARRAVLLNGATQIAITKMDVLYPKCAQNTSYDDLEDDVKIFIQKIEKELKLQVVIIGTGPNAKDVIDRR